MPVPVKRYFIVFQVRYELPNGNKRCYKFNRFVKPAKEQKIPDLKVTVEKYFSVRKISYVKIDTNGILLS